MFLRTSVCQKKISVFRSWWCSCFKSHCAGCWRKFFLWCKIVLHNLESQFTEILWSNLRDLALVTASILKRFLFCNWSYSVPSYFTDPSCKIQIRNLKPQCLQLLNLPKSTYPQNHASHDICLKQHWYLDFTLLEKARGCYTQDTGLSPSLSLQRTVTNPFKKNLSDCLSNFTPCLKGISSTINFGESCRFKM